MADIEKVIKAIEICFNPAGKCKKCPYDEAGAVPNCTKALGADALELLKEYKRQDGCPCTHCTVWECNEVCEEYKKWKNS